MIEDDPPQELLRADRFREGEHVVLSDALDEHRVTVEIDPCKTPSKIATHRFGFLVEARVEKTPAFLFDAESYNAFVLRSGFSNVVAARGQHAEECVV